MTAGIFPAVQDA